MTVSKMSDLIGLFKVVCWCIQTSVSDTFFSNWSTSNSRKIQTQAATRNLDHRDRPRK